MCGPPPMPSTLDISRCACDGTAQEAASIFQKHGFVILKGVLDPDAIKEVLKTCKELAACFTARDPARQGNRNPGRYSISHLQCLRLQSFSDHILNCGRVFDVLEALYGDRRFVVTRAGGDYVCGDTSAFQKLHSDMRVAKPLAPGRGHPRFGPAHRKQE